MSDKVIDNEVKTDKIIKGVPNGCIYWHEGYKNGLYVEKLEGNYNLTDIYSSLYEISQYGLGQTIHYIKTDDINRLYDEFINNYCMEYQGNNLDDIKAQIKGNTYEIKDPKTGEPLKDAKGKVKTIEDKVLYHHHLFSITSGNLGTLLKNIITKLGLTCCEFSQLPIKPKAQRNNNKNTSKSKKEKENEDVEEVNETKPTEETKETKKGGKTTQTSKPSKPSTTKRQTNKKNQDDKPIENKPSDKPIENKQDMEEIEITEDENGNFIDKDGNIYDEEGNPIEYLEEGEEGKENKQEDKQEDKQEEVKTSSIPIKGPLKRKSIKEANVKK